MASTITGVTRVDHNALDTITCKGCLALARASARAGLGAVSVGVAATVVSLALVDLCTLGAAALVPCFACAGTGARASLGAVSVGVAASIGYYTLVHLCADLATALVPGLAFAGWFGLLALFAFRTDCARAATTVFRVAVVNLITLDLAVSSKVSLTSARVSTGPGVAAQSLSVAVMLLVGVGAWVDRLARFAGAGKPILARARAGARAGLGAVSVGVAAAVGRLALVYLRALQFPPTSFSIVLEACLARA